MTLPSALNCFSLRSLYFQVGGVRSVTLPESLLFVSTLDGSLHAVSKQSGDIKWTLREGSRTVNLRLFIIFHLIFNYLMFPKLNRALISFRSHYSSPCVPYRVGDTCSQHPSLPYMTPHHYIFLLHKKCKNLGAYSNIVVVVINNDNNNNVLLFYAGQVFSQIPTMAVCTSWVANTRRA